MNMWSSTQVLLEYCSVVMQATTTVCTHLLRWEALITNDIILRPVLVQSYSTAAEGCCRYYWIGIRTGYIVY